ncbi:spherulin domain protein [Golovinomyces cichoracearum]|uniref:Spherulin domain protein n=1 Tax=Golovinomyces cichoracearum TaxID=62708 RepID=A0A420III9_9PEZI|nr:spherulin domain protein [Golovinomyces cichoracearum]
MSEKKKKTISSLLASSKTIIVPLYIYPFPKAWDPLYEAIRNYESLNFIVVLNPENGPGRQNHSHNHHGDEEKTNSIPDSNYIREIPKLNSFANVQTVGYVSTNWAKRDLELVLGDVTIYSNWSKKHRNESIPDLGVRGIFLDETLGCYTDSGAQFFKQLALFIRSEEIFGPNSLVRNFPNGSSHETILNFSVELFGKSLFSNFCHTQQIIHNPGLIPDSRYMQHCDISVIFEESYSEYQRCDFLAIAAFQKAANVRQEAIAYIIHSLPDNLQSSERKLLIQDLWCVSLFLLFSEIESGY